MRLQLWNVAAAVALGGCSWIASEPEPEAAEPAPRAIGPLEECECSGSAALGQRYFIRHCRCGALHCAMVYFNEIQQTGPVESTGQGRVAAHFSATSSPIALDCR